MSEFEKMLLKILRGGSDQNISFDGLCNLLENLGFDMRIKGSHHIFTREGVLEIVNLQPKKGKAKPYQVKQVRKLIVFYRLAGDTDE
jgi:predicted RNA binding protein YcfA (HicA-like mRNA interferase family)